MKTSLACMCVCINSLLFLQNEAFFVISTISQRIWLFPIKYQILLLQCNEAFRFVLFWQPRCHFRVFILHVHFNRKMSRSLYLIIRVKVNTFKSDSREWTFSRTQNSYPCKLFQTFLFRFNLSRDSCRVVFFLH